MHITPVIEFSPALRDILPPAPILNRAGISMVLLVRFQMERSLGFPSWLWQPKSEADHQEKLPSYPELDQAQTWLSEHWDVSADAVGVATNRAPASNASATSALKATFRATGTVCMYEPPAKGLNDNWGCARHPVHRRLSVPRRASPVPRQTSSPYSAENATKTRCRPELLRRFPNAENLRHGSQ